VSDANKRDAASRASAGICQVQLDPRRGVWALHAVLMAPFALFFVVATPLLFTVGVAEAALER
jgi:hypothetical protein